MMTASKPWTGRTFLMWICGFFAVIFAVNGVFLWLANDSWSGLSAENSYRRGVDFNRVIEQGERQAALGWQVDVSFESGSAGAGRFVLIARGPDGQPVSRREASAAFVRPVAEGMDFEVPLRAQEDGHYVADIELPAAGQWDVRAELTRPGADPYIVKTRIWSK